jgi:hypothetical protein
MQTINELQSSVQVGLEALRNIELSSDAVAARELLLPDGLTPVVELVNENGRRIRSDAASWNWNPQSHRILISFRPLSSAVASSPTSPTPLESAQTEPDPGLEHIGPQPEDAKAPVAAEALPDPVMPQEIVECCQALASAEKSNRQFIALKWFRDDFLATVDYGWARVPNRRQRVLSQAIDMGRIEAKKIHNPKAPQFPTTTIALNRSIPTPGVPPRFQPIPIRGEAASATLLRDRGSF